MATAQFRTALAKPQMELQQGASGQDWYSQLVALSPELAKRVKGEQKQFSESTLPQAPELDPRFQALKNKQIQLAQTFRQSMPAQQREQSAQIGGDSARGLQKDVSDIRGNAQGRGLLYSGLRGGAELGARQSAALGATQRRADMRKGMEDTASNLEDTAVQSGLGLAGMNTGEAAITAAQKRAGENAQMQTSLANQQMIGQIGGGLGSALGGILAGRRK